MSPAQDDRRGVVLMLLGMAVFCSGDALAKVTAAGTPLGEILLVRSVAALALLAPGLRRDWAAWQGARRPGLQVLRAALSVGDVAFFFLAVARLPLADATTFYLAGPIYVVALSALALGERVGWARWAAVALGFAGVAVALRPSGAMLGGAALPALAGSLCFATLMVVTRQLRGTPERLLTGFQFLGGLVVGALLLPLHPAPLRAADAAMLLANGVTSTGGTWLVNRSLRVARASVVVPYQYTMIVWASLFGWAVFGDVPPARVAAGAAIVVAAGLLIWGLERRERPAPAA